MSLKGWFARTFTAALLCAYTFSLLGGVADAQHVLPVLGTAPLLGQMSSLSDLQQRVTERRAMFETAAQDLGLTQDETSELVGRIMAGQARWVVVPRHLDEMTWAWDGSVYMYRDVVIPADEYGWQVDIRVGSNVHELFIPAACGNLSLVERHVQISYAPPPPAPQPPPQPPPQGPPSCPVGMIGNPPSCYYPQCPPGMIGTPPNCGAPQPQNTPPPQLTTVVVRNEVRQSSDWWLVPLAFIGFFFGGRYHSQPPPPPPPPIKCPPAPDP